MVAAAPPARALRRTSEVRFLPLTGLRSVRSGRCSQVPHAFGAYRFLVAMGRDDAMIFRGASMRLRTKTSISQLLVFENCAYAN